MLKLLFVVFFYLVAFYGTANTEKRLKSIRARNQYRKANGQFSKTKPKVKHKLKASIKIKTKKMRNIPVNYMGEQIGVIKLQQKW